MLHVHAVRVHLGLSLRTERVCLQVWTTVRWSGEMLKAGKTLLTEPRRASIAQVVHMQRGPEYGIYVGRA